MAAKTIATNVEVSTEANVVTINKREQGRNADLELNIDVPLFGRVKCQASNLVVARESWELGQQQIIRTHVLTAGFSECAREQKLVRIQPTERARTNGNKNNMGTS